MRRLEIGSIELPRIYVCSTLKDIKECRSRGIPYLVWRGDYDMLVKLVLYPTLRRMFPHVKWENALGLGNGLAHKADSLEVNVMDMAQDAGGWAAESNPVDGKAVDAYNEKAQELADLGLTGNKAGDDHMTAGQSGSYRVAHGEMPEEPVFSSTSLTDMVGDLSSMVNLVELQKMRLMPKWFGDIVDVVTKNLEDLAWQEGWNKKLGWPAGNHAGQEHLSNLIILDVSQSIPFGVAATMLSMIETLREQADADLIVTASTSAWYPKDKPLPSPKKLRELHPRGQESRMFNAILRDHVLGRQWGNVVCFGDNDSPERCDIWERDADLSVRTARSLQGSTSVRHVWSYHTHKARRLGTQPLAGYCRWCLDVSPDAVVTHNTDWVETIRD